MRFNLIPYEDGVENADRKFVLVPVNTPQPELGEDGIWHTDLEQAMMSGYRIINLVCVEAKEETAVPSIETVLTPEVLESVKRNLMRKYEHSIKATTSTFSDLLRLFGSQCSSYKESNPAFRNSANPKDIFTCREDVWYLLTDAIMKMMEVMPEVNGQFALKVMEDTRKGRYALGKMKEETEHTLQNLGISDYWITQMKETQYLPPKADMIIRLLDEMRAVWNEKHPTPERRTDG